MTYRILIVQPIPEEGLEVFDGRFEVKLAPDPSEATITRELKGVSGMIVRYDRVTREMLESADALKVIGRYGVGLDAIDLETATARGIAVVNTPDTNAISVAEHTLLAFGALAKKIVSMDRATRRGNWGARIDPELMELEGKTLGLIGLGSIGILVARKARAAFNMRVLAYDPYVRPETAVQTGVELIDDLCDIFRRADVVSVHTPLTPETECLVNAQRLRLMKRHAFLVNFARGRVVDEDALYEALAGGVIAGAALDVYGQEPPSPDCPLLGLDNVLLSPHSSALTREASARMTRCVAQGVVDVLTGRRPQHIVNPEVLV